MCKLHHLPCPHCLRALLVMKHCAHLADRRDYLAHTQNLPTWVDCPFFTLSPATARGSRESKDLEEELDEVFHFCGEKGWYVMPVLEGGLEDGKVKRPVGEV